MAATTHDGNWDFPIGAPVFTADGQRIGVVTEGDAYGLLVEDGFFVHHAYTLQLSDVERYEERSLLLKLTMAQIEERQR